MQLDLNLLTALDALLEEGSVTGAADRLHLSAPAMSRTLGRIRRATGDQILVRTGRTMTPTPHATAIREQVHALVHQAQAVLSPEREVDLGSLDRVFTLRWHDSITTAVGAELLALVRAQAPGVRLRFLVEPSFDTDDLRRGHVDLEASAGEPQLPEISRELVGLDRLVVVLRADHPLADRPLTAQGYAEAEHITVSRRGRLRDPVDDVLERHGLRRTVVAAAPTALAAMQLVRRGDFLTVVAERACGGLLADLGLTTSPIPVEMPAVPLYLAWHQRYDGDHAHAWLRALTSTVLRALGDAGTRAVARG
ncbi:LysR family transcriptional regulator [Umezawaea tangerina]|uniref:LysR family transcriptional regulator n=1 Tax=Umezawaea tangerina TaxID=84725 RepID=A0A2T0TGE1_9PSEU|nr:LysR family transcriptional regulator [Umezawaea tangerina]PRY44740.1 LysR family transcriptional regulator [Umezawaea tangerina]